MTIESSHSVLSIVARKQSEHNVRKEYKSPNFDKDTTNIPF
jgi:hypothetical protein